MLILIHMCLIDSGSFILQYEVYGEEIYLSNECVNQRTKRKEGVGGKTKQQKTKE